MAGLYGGTMTVGELLEHGDLGLGTLDSIDGELIVLDGKAYQAKGSGEQPEIVEVSPDALFLVCHLKPLAENDLCLMRYHCSVRNKGIW